MPLLTNEYLNYNPDFIKYLVNFTRSPLKFRSTENDDIRTYFEIGFEKCKQNVIN